ncbi:MAG TPA: acyloxyacyl hydrolase [Acidobacteriota bacterium]
MGAWRAGGFRRPLAVALLFSLFSAAPALAQATAEDPQATASHPSPLRPEGGNVWSVFYGLGLNQEINHSARNINIASAGVRWTHLWSPKLGGILRGHPGLGIEIVPVTAFVKDGQIAWALGGNLLYEHHFLAGRRVLPVWKIGAGFLYADREVPAGETRHNFSVLTALGVDVMVAERSALFLGYRFHHVSNADTGRINPGINAHTMMFGLTFYR